MSTKTIRINRLTLENFKGIKALTVDFDGNDSAIYGRNGTGKTSIFDAWTWLLFDKDSAGRASFGVKPHKDGQEIHNINVEVRADIVADGCSYTLTKTLCEKWTKKRGEEEAAYGGNEVTYMIDGIPKKAKEWAAFVNDLVDENVFKILSSVTHFNNTLGWKDRREILFSLVSDISELDMITDPKYKIVRELLSKHSVEDARKSLAFELKTLNKKLDQLPARIDEQSRNLSDISESAYNHAMDQKKLSQTRLDGLDAQLADFRTINQNVVSLHSAIADVESRKSAKVRAAREEALKGFYEGKRRLEEAERKRERAIHNKADYDATAELLREEYDAAETILSEYRKAFQEISREQFETPDLERGTCKTCGQKLPPMTAADIQSLDEAWTSDKLARLNKNKELGMALKAKNDIRSDEITKLLNKSDEAQHEVERMDALIAELQNYSGPEPAIEIRVDFSLEDLEIAEIKRKLEAVKSCDTTSIQDEKQKITMQMREYDAVIAQWNAQEKASARIEELKREEKALAQQISELEKKRNLLEKLESERCTRLEERINNLFPTVRWKLFKEQVNGGLADCCDCIIGGALYADANNAARINAGLEIIGVLSGKFGISAPIFVDNAESINRLLNVSAQQISLVVSNDKALRVELIDNREVA